VLDAFPVKLGVQKGRRDYTLRLAEAGDGKDYTVGILRLIEQGTGEAQNAARDLIDDLSPSLIIVVGIAGGLPSDDYTLGDVVVSTRVNDYCVEARKTRSDATYNLSGGPVGKKIAAFVANLSARQAELGNWGAELPRKPKVQWKQQGRLYGPKKWRDELSEKLELHFGRYVDPRSPTFISGAIASSDRLVKDPAILIPWLSVSRHLLAVEMESAGVYRAAGDGCPMLAIRGISDIVGLKRDDGWTKYACKSAAFFTRAFLRTQPVAPKSDVAKSRVRPDSHPEADDSDEPPMELYSNFVPLLDFPKKIFVAPAKVSTYPQAWAKLRGREKGFVTNAWLLNNNNVFSFHDPDDSSLRRIADVNSVEAHDTEDFALSDDPEKRRIFVQLANGALRDDLHLEGVWYWRKDGVYSFAGFPDDEPRTYTYRNVRLKSTLTVVGHYEKTRKKDGKKFLHLRHQSFEGRFVRWGEKWFLEINPTYRYTSDGKKKYLFHEENLSGIKRIEGNRAVLSQVMLWVHLLTSPTDNRQYPRWLTFGKNPMFPVELPPVQADLQNDRSKLRRSDSKHQRHEAPAI